MRNNGWGTDMAALLNYAAKHLQHLGLTVSSPKPTSAHQICEDLLLECKRYNIEHDILPSENAVVDRLLVRRLELKSAYKELYSRLCQYPSALKVFLDLLLGTAAFWNPEKISQARTARNDLADVNRQIAGKAADLADLLARRSDLHNTSDFSSSTHYHVCDVIEVASEGNYLFTSHVKPRLDALSGQYDLKYWPSLSQFLQAIAADAERANIEANNPMTDAATAAIRSSRADFFKALFAAIEENRAENYGLLPRGFKLSDRTLASLANCVLDLGPDDPVEEAYVKRLRQHIREKAR